jgi:hypothetical protein
MKFRPIESDTNLGISRNKEPISKDFVFVELSLSRNETMRNETIEMGEKLDVLSAGLYDIRLPVYAVPMMYDYLYERLPLYL